MNAFARVLTSILLIIYYLLEGLVLLFVPKRLRYKDVSGETVLITGAGSGIGRLLAIRFSRLGARVVIWDVNVKGARETADIISKDGREAHVYECDISKPEIVYATAAKVKKEVGKVTMLINNAGIVTGKRFLECPDNMIQKTFEVNAISHFWTCKAFLPEMMEADHGHIVSIASMAGLAGVVRLSDYCASKFAAVGLEESLRMELHVDGYHGIKSTVVCPYFINTGMFSGARPGIFSMMTPEYVADEIVSAVLVNQEILMLPKIFYFLVALKWIVPTHAVREAFAIMSILSVMTKFSGRGEKNCNGYHDHVKSEPESVENRVEDSTCDNEHVILGSTNVGDKIPPLVNNNIIIENISGLCDGEYGETVKSNCFVIKDDSSEFINGKVKSL